MKSVYSENFYFENWERMMAIYGKDADLEKKLELSMNKYEALPTVALEVVKKIEAESIANRCKQLMIEKMEVIKNIENGVSSMGYTTKRQEVEARHKLRQGFEFTCLALREFKKKYGIA